MRGEQLELEQVRELITPVLDHRLIVAAALQLDEQAFAALVISKKDAILKIIYQNPQGIARAGHVKELIDTIKEVAGEEGLANLVLDLKHEQQVNNADSMAAFTISNLVALVRKDASSTTKVAELKELLAKKEQVNDIKAKHGIIIDTNPWYSDDKLKKLLEISLKHEHSQATVAAITVFESKDLVVENIGTAAREVMATGLPAVVPIHIHGNHWTGLVIKKQADDSLQLIYNDPQGNSISNELNFGKLLKTIGNINSNFQFIDLQKTQQANDDDCGPFTIDNLIKLVVNDTDHLIASKISSLLLTDLKNGELGHVLRVQHVSLLREDGIPVVDAPPHILQEAIGSTVNTADHANNNNNDNTIDTEQLANAASSLSQKTAVDSTVSMASYSSNNNNNDITNNEQPISASSSILEDTTDSTLSTAGYIDSVVSMAAYSNNNNTASDDPSLTPNYINLTGVNSDIEPLGMAANTTSQ